MLQIKPDLRSYSRASYLRELHGDSEGAIVAMKMAADAGMTGEENRAWVLYNLGNLYLQTGRTDTASFIYHGILDERPGYAYALSGLARIEIIRQNYSKAIEYLEKASLNLDDHSFPEQLAGLYHALNNKREEEKLVRLILSEFAEHKKRGWIIDLEYAVFCLNHNINLKEALNSAGREYQRRPDNIQVIDTYAWALYKNGKLRQSSEIIKKALESDYRNPLIYYHAGLINLSLNNNRQAVKNLEAALAQNLAVHLSCYKDALEKLREVKELAILK
jgi:tetratricopeptide (TPR) repeat protein